MATMWGWGDVLPVRPGAEALMHTCEPARAFLGAWSFRLRPRMILRQQLSPRLFAMEALSLPESAGPGLPRPCRGPVCGAVGAGRKLPEPGMPES